MIDEQILDDISFCLNFYEDNFVKRRTDTYHCGDKCEYYECTKCDEEIILFDRCGTQVAEKEDLIHKDHCEGNKIINRLQSYLNVEYEILNNK